MGRKANINNTKPSKVSESKKNESKSPKPPNPPTEEKPKKKRGRKPKVLTEEEIRLKNQPKVHKKRGRKPKEKFNFETSVLTYNKYENAENDSIIIKLPFTRESINLNQTVPISPQNNKDNNHARQHLVHQFH